jgi:transcription elongation GreA/GreB family factor
MQLEPIIPRGKPHMQKSAAKKRSKQRLLGREVIGKRVGDSINVKSAYGRFQFVISQID